MTKEKLNVDENGKVECKICGKKCDLKSGYITRHIKTDHGLSKYEYFIKYIDNIKYCKYCGKECMFNSLKKGFYKTCGELICKNKSKKQDRIDNPDKYERDEEYRRKLSESQKGKKFTKEHKENISKSRIKLNIKWTDEQKKQHSKKLKQWHIDNPEGHKKQVEHLHNIQILTTTPEAKEKRKQTCLDRYGVSNTFQTEMVRKNQKISFKKNKEQIQEKTRKTCLNRYGVEYTSQVPEIYAKCCKNRTKKYIMPSGKIISVQGYESFALDILLETYNENKILTDKKDMPKIWYFDDNKKKHRYYCDIYIPHENRLIEVKSRYYYEFELQKNILKHNASIADGYNHEIWIIDNKASIEEIIYHV